MIMKIEAQPTTSTTAEAAQAKAEARLLLEENGKLRAALLIARIAVSHACELSDRILYTQDLARINAALGEKE
jgi:hypothetical protein